MRNPIAAAGIAALLALPCVARAQGQLLPTPAVTPTVPVTARTPTFTDDSTAGYAAGSTWLADDLYTNQAATAGAAVWMLTPDHLLPADQIGLRLSAVPALSAAGTGYAVGNTITLTGGAVVTVATITGGGSTGPVGTVTLTNPAYHACANTTAGGLAQLATSGSGSGATFTGTFVGPYVYGARLLTVCYKANKAIDVAGGALAQTTIGFATNGLIDTATMDSLLVGARPALLALYDQGINGANGSQTSGYAGSISPLRTVHGVRTLVMDGDIDGVLDSGAPGVITTVNFPSALTVNNQANTLIVSGGVQSLDHRAGLIDIGYNTSIQSALTNKAVAATPNIALTDNNGAGAVCPGLPLDRDNVIFGVSTASARTCTLNGVTGSAASAPASGNAVGGNLGFIYDNQAGGYVDYNLAIVVPWAMSAAEITAADASIQSIFAIQRQPHSLLYVDGDSISDGHGSPGQHGWGRMLGEMLQRPDITIRNASFYGSAMGGTAINGSPGSRLTEQPLNVLPGLDTAYAQNAPNIYVLVNPMGNNDLVRGDSVATIEANYQTYCSNVHAHHGKCVLSYFVNSTVGQYGSASYATIAQWLAANASGTGPGADIVVPIPACPSGVACYQSDNLHPGQPNDAIMARAFIQALAPVLK